MKKALLQNLFACFVALSLANSAKASMQEFTLPPLPYKENALEPYISQRTLFFHYGKHHQGYVNTTNKLAKEKGLLGLTLENLIKKSAKDPSLKPLFHAAAQDWNHTFYWSSMR